VSAGSPVSVGFVMDGGSDRASDRTSDRTGERPGDQVVTAVPPVVQLRDAVAVLGSFPALAGATITVTTGEIVLLRGPNGAGKTSLLRLCAGLLPLERGEGRVFGFDLATEAASVRPRVGMLGHRNGLYSDLSVVENVRFWGATVAATDAEIDAAMHRLGVGGRLRTVSVSRLSAGQKRRTALACLVARRAELWLLDEPHAGLDAQGRDELDAVLQQAVASGATVMIASHELERAGSLAHRIVDVVAGQTNAAPHRDSPAGDTVGDLS
jgi:heme ABC exporter ATP-binding subunit CcmA